MGEGSEGGTPVPWGNSLRVTDVDELNHAVSGSDLEIVQLGPGVLDAEVRHVSIGDLSLDRGTVNLPLRVLGSLDPLRFGIGLFDPGARATYNGNPVDASRLLYFMPGGELNGYLQPPYAWTSLVIPPAWIESIAATSQCSLSFRLSVECAVVRPEPVKLRELLLAADSIIRSTIIPADGGWSATQLRNALGEALCVLDPPRRKEVSHVLAHFSTARKAERYMRERLDEPLRIDDMCIALHVSRRYLEYAFNNAFGTSPSRYLRLLRLHEVRQRLKTGHAGMTVTQEALRLGFNHLSLFALQYKKTFGESPSVTLASRIAGRALQPRVL